MAKWRITSEAFGAVAVGSHKPNRSPESIEQRRQYARERSRRRYAQEKDKVLEEIAKYKQGETWKAGAERRKKYTREYQKKLRRARAKWLHDYKRDVGCESCGFSHPAALDFHHLDPNEKIAEVSKMAHSLVPIEQLIDEISKCTILCANCHRILHYVEVSD
jgi:hypothetical protein